MDADIHKYVNSIILQNHMQSSMYMCMHVYTCTYIIILGRCKHRGGEPSLRCSLTSLYTLYIIVKSDSYDWMKGSKKYQNLNGMKREAA